MEEYVRSRVERITNPVMYQYGMESRESIYWQLNELVQLSWRYLKNQQLAEEIRKIRDEYK